MGLLTFYINVTLDGCVDHQAVGGGAAAVPLPPWRVSEER
jgi:hypothetical protein